MDQKDAAAMDLMWGASAIAQFIGRSDRQTFKLLEDGALPAKKVGNRWVAKRSELERFFREVAA